jgi:hypothetical protein
MILDSGSTELTLFDFQLLSFSFYLLSFKFYILSIEARIMSESHRGARPIPAMAAISMIVEKRSYQLASVRA